MNSYKVLISVVMPIYNPNLSYLEEAVSSVINQSYKNFELIISDDTLGDIAMDFISSRYNDDRIFYVKNPGKKGIFYNLNNAISNSSGNFIQILCQDDILHANCLEKQYSTILKYPNVGFVYAQVNQIDENSKLTEIISIDYGDKSMYKNSSVTINLFFKHGCLPGNLSPVMLPKKIIDDVGYFDAAFTYGGDFEYWIRIAEKQYGMAINLAPLLALRHHNDRASISLGKMVWLNDIWSCYFKLFKINTLQISSIRKILYINERIGIQALKVVTRHIFKTGRFSALSLLFKFPLNLILIFFALVFSINGRIKLMKINELKFEDEN